MNNSESKPPPASEAGAQTPECDEFGRQPMEYIEGKAPSQICAIGWERKARSLELRLATATRELGEAKVRVKQLEDAKPDHWLPKSVAVSDIAAEAIQLRSDLLLARRQGEEMRKLLVECHAHLCTEIKALTLNESASSGSQSLLRKLSVYLDATPSPQANPPANPAPNRLDDTEFLIGGHGTIEERRAALAAILARQLTTPNTPGPIKCFWGSGCANSERCREFGSCLAQTQRREAMTDATIKELTTAQKQNKDFERLFGLDTTWTTVCLYKALVIAESKLREQGRDFDGWESIQTAAAVAQQRVSEFLKE